MIRQGLDGIAAVPFDVCVVGAGPSGIALAMACERQGLVVLLLESGSVSEHDEQASLLSSGHEIDPARHALPEVSLARGLGGTSKLWGGRCVPFDPLDFDARVQVPEADWPITHEDIHKFHEAASEFLGLGAADFVRESPAWAALDGGVSFGALERWAPIKDMGLRHRDWLTASRRVTCILGATVTGLRLSTDERSVVSVVLGDEPLELDLLGRPIVLAAGGLETTRLLLVTQRSHPNALGGVEGVLGRYYMGHLTGRIADLHFRDPLQIKTADFFPAGKSYARRRFTLARELQQQEHLLNTVFWVDQPHASAAREHRNGLLSIVWLAMFVPFIGRHLVSESLRRLYVGQRPYQIRTHCLNVIRAPLSTFRQASALLWGKFSRHPKVPGFIARNRLGYYPLQYHAEQSPWRASRIVLSDKCDRLGMPFLKIEYQFDPSDFEALLRAHRVLDAALRRSGLGWLQFHGDTDTELLERIALQATDGYHQIGTARMGVSPSDSVVDRNCRAHGLENLHVASSAVFRSSSQANPTLTAVALAFRLAEHLAGQVGRRTAAQAQPLRATVG